MKAKPILLSAVLIFFCVLYHDATIIWDTYLFLKRPATWAFVLVCLLAYGFFKHFIVERYGVDH